MTTGHNLSLFHLLLSLTNRRLSESDQTCLEKIATLSVQEVWSLLELAEYHSVFERVGANLLHLNSGNLSQEVLVPIRERMLVTIGRNMQMAKSLAICLKSFAKAGISAVPFKGPIFNLEILGDLGLRVFADLDILVAPDDVWRASQVLSREGYLPLCRLDEQQLKKVVLTDNELPHIHHATGHCVDLQWELGGGYTQQPITIESFRGRLRPILFLGVETVTFCFEDLAVYLAVHGMQHDWSNLGQITCLFEVVLRNGNFHWPDAWERSHVLGAEKSFALGLQLTQSLYGLELQLNSKKRRINIPSIRHVTEDIVKNIVARIPDNDYSASRSRFSRAHYKLLPGIWYRGAYLARLFFRPTRYDWEILALPPRLAGLHWIVRPLRLLGNYCSLLLRSMLPRSKFQDVRRIEK